MKLLRFNAYVFIALALLVTHCKKDEDTRSIYQPVITELIPAKGPVNTEVIIVGHRFSVEAETNIVRCGTINLEVLRVTTDTLWVRVPKKAKTDYITVQVTDIKETDEAKSPTTFTVLDPVVTGYEPAQGIAGDTITITGQYFNPTAADFAVKLKDKPFGTILTKTDTTIRLVIATHLHSGPVTLTTFAQKVTGPDFVILPVIESVTPLSAPENLPVTIRGTNFLPSPTVRFDNTQGTITASTDTLITVTVPALLNPGEDSHEVSLTVSVNGYASEAIPLIILPSTAPVIYTITPAVASPGETITLTGDQFGTDKNAITITFPGRSGRVTATIQTLRNDQAIVTVPTGTITGEVYLTKETITAHGGPFILPIKYEQFNPPVLWEGSTLTIVGENFPPKAEDIRVGFKQNENNGGMPVQVPARRVNTSLTELDVIIPGGLKNNQPITITYLGQTFTEPSVLLQVVRPAPQTITPAVGPVGSVVTISGYGFSSYAPDNKVFFPGANAPATVLEASYTSLTVQVPPGTTEGYVQVQVLASAAIKGPYFKLGTPPPVIFVANSGTFPSAVGVYRLAFVEGPTGTTTQFDQVLDLPVKDLAISPSTGKLYAIDDTHLWEATIKTSGTLSWQELYAGTAAIDGLHGIATDGTYLYLATRKNLAQSDASNGAILKLPANGSGPVTVLYNKDNGFLLTNSEPASFNTRLAVNASGQLAWATKSNTGPLYGMNKPSHIMIGTTQGATATERYSAQQILQSADYPTVGTPNSNTRDADLITDLQLLDNGDIYCCILTPYDLGSNIGGYQKIFRGTNGTTALTQLLKGDTGNIRDLDYVKSALLYKNEIYGSLFGSYVPGAGLKPDILFKMTQSQTGFKTVFTIPYGADSYSGMAEVMVIY